MSDWTSRADELVALQRRHRHSPASTRTTQRDSSEALRGDRVSSARLWGMWGLAILECPKPFVFKGFELRATRRRNPELAEIHREAAGIRPERWQNG